MRMIDLNSLAEDEVKQLYKRPAINIDGTLEIVKPVVSEIKTEGMNKILFYAEKYDGFIGENLLATDEEYSEAEDILEERTKSAIRSAAENITAFHKKQLPEGYELETQPGVLCSRQYRPIENVGLYIPGGTAVLPSTVLMLGIPAALAGCKRIVACSPTKNKINPAVLYAARIAGITEFYKLGGAQAIAMMAYGTETIQKVDKIFGPGNQYVTAAKMLVSMDADGCLIDMPAGPSEVLVIADQYADPSYIASDLLSQAEHGQDSQVILITNSKELAVSVQKEIADQTDVLPRKGIVEKCLTNSFILIVNQIEEAIKFSNNYAPEHLILNIENSENFISSINNAGSVFIGPYSPESAGDYASGTNHSLPTYGYAKAIGGVNVEMFLKSITFQKLSRDGLKNISGTVIELAETEGLQAHANAIKVRLR